MEDALLFNFRISEHASIHDFQTNYVITVALLMPKKYEATGYIVSDNKYFKIFNFTYFRQ